MTQVVLYGQSGQSLRHVPPSRVTGTPTYAIEDLTKPDDDAARIIASGNATVAGWSATTSAIAGPTQSNAKRMSTADTSTAAVGDRAAIVAADGTTEIFEIAAVSSSTYLEAETALAGVYPSGSTVYGIEISASVPIGLYSDEDILEQRRPLRVVWTYTIGGVTLKKQDLIEFRRHSTAATTDVGEAVLRVRKLYPDLPERLPDYADLGTIAAELVAVVEDDLRQRKIRPELFLTGPASAQLLFLRIVAHAGDLGYAPLDQDQRAWADRAMRAYERRLEALVIGEPGEATAETSHVSDTAPSIPSHEYRGPTLRM